METNRSAIEVAKFDEGKLQQYSWHGGKHPLTHDWAFKEPDCLVGFLEYDETEVPCGFPTNEVQYVISGKAEYTYTCYPDHNEERKIVVEAGDAIRIRWGTLINFKAIEKPYRVVWVAMPPREFEPDVSQFKALLGDAQG